MCKPLARARIQPKKSLKPGRCVKAYHATAACGAQSGKAHHELRRQRRPPVAGSGLDDAGGARPLPGAEAATGRLVTNHPLAADVGREGRGHPCGQRLGPGVPSGVPDLRCLHRETGGTSP